jgi:peptidoglycan/LPS O-acetylase OafA/YrhL
MTTVGDPSVGVERDRSLPHVVASDEVPARRTPLIPHEPALDGLRGLAIVGVLLYHSSILDDLPGLGRRVGGGFLGVSAFFTLSGFLITSLLVLERERDGTISLRGFWSRRFRRLMPASLLLLLAVALLTPRVGSDAQLSALPGDIWSALGYVFNWHSILGQSDYAASFATSQSPLKHVWSLSVEEQWYLLLPLVVAGVLLVTRGSRRALAVTFAALAAGSTALMWALGHGAYANRTYLGTDTRLAEMAIGGLLAVLVAGRARSPERSRGPSRRPRLDVALDVAGVALLGAGVWVWTSSHLQDGWLYRGGFALHAAGVAMVIALAFRPGSIVRRLLRFRPLAFLGRISYGTYLFHWPLLLWLTPERLRVSHAVAPLIQLPATVAVAWLSYRLLEGPIRTGQRLVAWRRAVAPAVAVGVIALVVATMPTPDLSRITALEPTQEITSARQLGSSDRMFVPTTTAHSSDHPASGGRGVTATTAAPPRPVRLVVAGDSFAMSLIPGMRVVAMARGDFSFIDAALVGCGFGRGGRNRGIGLDVEYSKECRQRDTWVSAGISRIHPDVVVFAGGLWDVTDRKPTGFPRWTHVGDPRYDLYLAGEIRHLVQLAQVEGAQVVWLDAPHWNPRYDPANFMGRPPYAEADPARVDRYNQLLHATLAGLPGVQILSIADWLRSQPGGEFAPGLRNDGVHFTTAASTTAAQWLVPQLIDIGRAHPVSTGDGSGGAGDQTVPDQFPHGR